jgi:nitric oxide reductase NorQ protein
MGGECRDSVVVYPEIGETKRELAAREWSAGAPFPPAFPRHLETTMTTPPPPALAPASAPRITPAGRLGQGELRRQVAGCLAADPAAEFTPGSVARALGKSAGATGNALATLAGRGEAERLPGPLPRHGGHRPRRRRRAARRSRPAPRARRPGRPGLIRAGPARPGRLRRRPAGCGAGDPPGRAGLPAPHAGRHGRCDRAARGGHRGPALRAARHRQDILVEAAFPDLITIAGDGDTTVADFTGDYTQRPDGTYEFIYGPLIRAMTEGRALLIDDATLISPQVLAVAYPAMDGRREITVKACKGQTIKAAPGFYVIGGHNPGVHGAVLTEALASRFAVQIQVATDYDLARSLKIEPRAITVARTLARRQAAGEIGWAPQLRELIAFDKITRVLGLDAAVANLAGIAPEEDRDVVTETAASAFGRPVAPLALGRQI